MTHRLCLRLLPHPERLGVSLSKILQDTRDIVYQALEASNENFEIYTDRAGWIVGGSPTLLVAARILPPDAGAIPRASVDQGYTRSYTPMVAVEVCISTSEALGPGAGLLVRMARILAEGSREKGYGVLLEGCPPA